MLTRDAILGVAVAAVMLLAAVSIPVFFAWCEASAYNRVTGANVSTWDALFIELRVDGVPKRETEATP